MRTHFLYPVVRKKRLGQFRLIDVWISRMALKTHNWPSGSLIKRLLNSMKRCFNVSKGHTNSFPASRASKKATLIESLVFFYIGEWAWELIICLLNVVKCDLGEVAEAIFYDVERPFEPIFYILHIQKAMCTKSRKWCFKQRMALRTHNLSSRSLKNRRWWSRWRDVSRSRKAIRTLSLHPGHRKSTWIESLVIF
jgi:hypothetical protein